MATRSLATTLRDRLPFLRWSMLRFLLSGRTFNRTGQVGDGRERAARDFVLANSPAGDPDKVLAAFDDFARNHSILVNIGDEKGLILDAALRKTAPKLLLALGGYCGYSAIRTARLLGDDAHLVSVEMNPDNADIARSLLAHAGLADRVTVVVGTIGDGGQTVKLLADQHGFGPGTLDFIFLDHDKSAYLPDLKTIADAGWLHPGSVVVADNVGIPGAPAYHAYMRESEGTTWRTTEHRTHTEYQSLLKDLVLESEYLG
ncbi:Catechol O-methyltransferase [Nocardia seriolae]|uniref:Catechol O-methyltransferase n=1 Tax=Nocardia seriolae TaxID=37332 RepID=A0ABC8AX79_9NOCA|nr:O-methyltransferase [Nocardia seriolae]APA98879.1 Catechol O-methyltransferase [Nocardia seriolae]